MTFTQIIILIFVCIVGYLLGSIPFTVWIGKLATGKDLRDYHSQNPGGFNAVRTYGFNLGVLLLFLDQLKGVVSILIADQLFSQDFFIVNGTGFNPYHTLACILTPTLCVLGHNYPLWLKFRGGQGMGVYMGVLMYSNPLLLLIFFLFHTIFYVGLKMPTRRAGTIAIILSVFPAFFLPLSPPWTQILSDWTAGGATKFLFLTQGLMITGMVLAMLLKRLQNFLFGTNIKQETFLGKNR